ncbi:MAG: S16 family serine protease [Candidatus Micrarchaeota archaeon]
MRNFYLVLVVCFLVALLIGFESKSAFTIQKPAIPTIQPVVEIGDISLAVPAVDKDGNGTLAELRIRMMAGTGKTFFSMDEGAPYLNPETQASFRMAMKVAGDFSGIAIADRDFYFSIQGPSDVVGGRSAGAAASVAIISLLKKDSLRNDTIITGNVDETGKIGRVGQIWEKFKAVKAAEYFRFIIPEGEAVVELPPEECQKNPTAICKPERETFDLRALGSIQVIEVKNIAEAYKEMSQ